MTATAQNSSSFARCVCPIETARELAALVERLERMRTQAAPPTPEGAAAGAPTEAMVAAYVEDLERKPDGFARRTPAHVFRTRLAREAPALAGTFAARLERLIGPAGRSGGVQAIASPVRAVQIEGSATRAALPWRSRSGRRSAETGPTRQTTRRSLASRRKRQNSWI